MGNRLSGVDIPQNVQTLGEAEAWAKASGFTMPEAQAVGRLSRISRPHRARATAAWLGSACGFKLSFSHHY